MKSEGLKRFYVENIAYPVRVSRRLRSYRKPGTGLIFAPFFQCNHLILIDFVALKGCSLPRGVQSFVETSWQKAPSLRDISSPDTISNSDHHSEKNHLLTSPGTSSSYIKPEHNFWLKYITICPIHEEAEIYSISGHRASTYARKDSIPFGAEERRDVLYEDCYKIKLIS